MKRDDEHDELDDFLKDKFSGHTIAPSPGLWKKVKPQLASRGVVSFNKFKKLKVALYGSVAALTAAVLLLVASNQHIFNSNEIADETAIESTISQSSTIETPQLTENRNTDFNEPSNELEKEKKSGSPSTETQSGHPLQDANEIPLHTENNVSKSTETPKIKSTTKVVYNEQLNPSNQPKDLAASTPTLKPEVADSETENNASVEPPLLTDSELLNLIKTGEKDGDSGFEKNTVTITLDKTETLLSLADSSSTIERNKEEIIEEGKPQELAENILKEDANEKRSTASVFDPVKNNAKGIAKKLKTDLISKEKKTQKIEWGIFGTPEYTSHLIQDGTLNQQLDDDAEYKDEVNDGAITWSAGAFANIPVSPKFYISTGIGFAQYRQQMNLNRDNFIALDENKYSFHSSAGDINLKYTGSDILQHTATVKSYLNLSYAELPLQFGYRINSNLAIQTGAFYRRLIKADVDFKANSDSDDLDFTGIAGIQKNNYGVSLGVNYKKSISNQLALSIGTEAKYQLTPVNHTTTQKLFPWSIGLKAALIFSRL